MQHTSRVHYSAALARISYVTLSAKHRNFIFFRLSAIMAEDLPCFELWLPVG